MPEVPQHLVPTDGLTDSRLRLAGLDTHENSGAVTVRFDIHDEDKYYVATLKIPVGPTAAGTIDAMVAGAYQELTDMLRQWLYEADKMREAYGKRAAQ